MAGYEDKWKFPVCGNKLPHVQTHMGLSRMTLRQSISNTICTINMQFQAYQYNNRLYCWTWSVLTSKGLVSCGFLTISSCHIYITQVVIANDLHFLQHALPGTPHRSLNFFKVPLFKGSSFVVLYTYLVWIHSNRYHLNQHVRYTSVSLSGCAVLL